MVELIEDTRLKLVFLKISIKEQGRQKTKTLLKRKIKGEKWRKV